MFFRCHYLIVRMCNIFITVVSLLKCLELFYAPQYIRIYDNNSCICQHIDMFRHCVLMSIRNDVYPKKIFFEKSKKVKKCVDIYMTENKVKEGGGDLNNKWN